MYKFVKTKEKDNSYDAADVVHRISNNDLTWHDLIEHFVCFLRGCSYIIGEGEYVEEKHLDAYIDSTVHESLQTVMADMDKLGKLNAYLVHPDPLLRSAATKYKTRKDGVED